MEKIRALLAAVAASLILNGCLPALAEMRIEVKVASRPTIEQFFGPSPTRILDAIHQTAGEPQSGELRADKLPHSKRRNRFVEDCGAPLPKEDWQNTTWFVEGHWRQLKTIENPGTNLCDFCKETTTPPSTTLWLRYWRDLALKTEAHDAERSCPDCGASFAFDVKRFAEVRIQTSTITYSRKDDATQIVKVPRYSVRCLRTCESWESMLVEGFAQEEDARMAKRKAWREERKAETHPKKSE